MQPHLGDIAHCDISFKKTAQVTLGPKIDQNWGQKLPRAHLAVAALWEISLKKQLKSLWVQKLGTKTASRSFGCYCSAMNCSLSSQTTILHTLLV